MTTATSGLNWVDSITQPWAANYIRNNMYMPAYWNISFQASQPCYDPNTPANTQPPFTPLPNPQVLNNFALLPGVGGVTPWYGYFVEGGANSTTPAPAPTPISFTCFINTPANPQISQTGVTPRFVLDDYLPSTVREESLQQINAQPQYTFLHLYAPNLSTVATVPATSVDPSGMSATFAYPRQSNGTSLPAGPYISTITTDIPGQNETTNSIEPIVIGHDNTTYPGAFGVAYVSNLTKEIDTYGDWQGDDIGCQTYDVEHSHSGITGILVTSFTQNALLTANGSFPVGANPTVVLPINYVYDDNVQSDGQCTTYEISNQGPQSALVVNTGGASVSVVQIGGETLPSGTITVGRQPVAAVVGTNGYVYVANYGDGTISEVDTTNLIVRRTLNVMAHPSSLAFDGSGTLWVGGQGAMDAINLNTWAISSTQTADGTVSQLAFSKQQNAMVQVLLHNGTVSSPSNGSTGSRPVAFNTTQSSYSSAAMVNTSTGATVSPQLAAVSNAAYISSPIASQLAFAAQTALAPATLSGSGISSPLLTSVSGDVVAVANGNAFTLSSLPTGEPLMSGTLPYPIRGVAIGGNVVYFTMTESGSVVTVPFNF